tara:strand:- start:1244 stop:1570 length:327 start_codon:yes stop_codon:yes gene_type:complete
MFENKNTLVYVLLAIVVFFLISNKMKESFNSGSNLSGCYKMDTNMCSPDCCGKQWPLSFDLKKDPRIGNELGKKYIATNMTCTGKMGTGCVCADPKQYEFLSMRGNNA